jgi:hypothetical protein
MTPPHIIEAIRKFQSAILPAVLDPNRTVENGTILFAWCNTNGIAFDEVTPDDLRRAASAEAAKLYWSVKPAKLRDTSKEAQGVSKGPNRIAVKEEADKGNAARLQTQKAAEKSLADAKVFKEVDQAIAAFYPTTRFGTFDGATQAKERTRLTTWVETLKGGFKAEAILKAVVVEINKLYAAEEKSRERV